MYEAFDRFLASSTWHSGHESDDQRFFQILHTIVRRDDFNADALAAHMRQATNATEDGPDEGYYWKRIDAFRDKAWAVRDYLLAIGKL